MFDNNAFIEGNCKNVTENDQVISYEMKTHITYYSAIPLSMINYFRVEEDGVAVPQENIIVAFDEEDWFHLSELSTISEIKWEYGTPVTVRVLKEGGLSKGTHSIKLTVCTRTAYIPVLLEGNTTRTVVID